MGKKVYIVFEETGEHGGKGFHVYLDGVTQPADKMTPEEQLQKLTTAEFWGLRCFQICSGILNETGVVKEIIPKPGSK